MSEGEAPHRYVRDLGAHVGHALWNGFIGFYTGDNLTYAASIAYYALLSMFPFSMLAMAILGSVTADEQVRQSVFNFVLQYFPKQFEFITIQIDLFRTGSLTFGIIGTLGLVWGATGFFGAVSTAINHAWRVKKTRSYWGHKLFSFLMLSVAGGLLVAALLLVSATQVVSASWFAEVLGRFPGLLILRSFALRWASTLMFILVVALIFRFAPNVSVRFRDVWVGAFLTAMLWRGVLEAFSWYMRDMTQFTRVNGSIAAVVVFLVWVYVQAVILLYGAEFTAAFGLKRRSRETLLVPRLTVPTEPEGRRA